MTLPWGQLHLVGEVGLVPCVRGRVGTPGVVLVEGGVTEVDTGVDDGDGLPLARRPGGLPRVGRAGEGVAPGVGRALLGHDRLDRDDVVAGRECVELGAVDGDRDTGDAVDRRVQLGGVGDGVDDVVGGLLDGAGGVAEAACLRSDAAGDVTRRGQVELDEDGHDALGVLDLVLLEPARLGTGHGVGG